MKEYKTQNIRNIALVSHSSAGKTMLAEAFLHFTGITTRLGRIEDGTTVSDFEEEEIKRQSSISTAFGHVEYNKHLIHIVDSPGDANFVADSFHTIYAADTAIFAVDAIDGVKVQTAKLWDIAGELGMARMIVVTTLDRDRSSFDDALNSISEMLEVEPTPLTVPTSVGEGFNAVADLLKNKLLNK